MLIHEIHVSGEFCRYEGVSQTNVRLFTGMRHIRWTAAENIMKLWSCQLNNIFNIVFLYIFCIFVSQ